MRTAIVVDDEKWIVEGIKAGVDWLHYGFEVIGDAENGQDALRLIETLHPDLVFTDIKMPIMNGLELVQRGKALSPDTQFVVLSGHAEFAYAQKALNYGTFGYCLKPFEIDEIHGMLGRLSQVLKSRESAIDWKTSPSYELSEAIGSGDTERMNRLMATRGLSADSNSPLTPVVLHSRTRPSSIPGVKHLTFPMSRSRYGYLVQDRYKGELLRSLEQACGQDDYGAGVGYPITEASQLDASLEAASLAAYGRFSSGRSGVYPAPASASASASTVAPAPSSVPGDVPIEDTLKELAQALSRQDRVGFLSIMDQASSLFRSGTYTIKEAYLIYTSVLYLYPREGARPSGRFFEGYEQLYSHYGTADCMIEDLVRITLDSFGGGADSGMPDISHKKVREIMLYIRDHFNQEISIQSLADRFYLSPNYLCQLFKKEVGETIIEHLSKLRIDYACKLLRQTDLSIYQVGEKSGFQDYFYFTRIFKRFHKMTPTQYREQA